MPSPNLSALLGRLNPAKTVLLLGAGASKSSGAPLAMELCRALEKQFAVAEPISDDLAELSAILERRHGRRAVVETLLRQLKDLRPDGALLTLAEYPWRSIFTTNYDTLIEDAFREKRKPLSVVRSNFDWENAHQVGAVPYFKVHGCLSQDRSLGHQASMILTAGDYSDFEKYRQLLFNRLGQDMAGGILWVVGHSLRDPHIKALAEEALRLQQHAGAPGQIYLLAREYDEDRAALWIQRGIHDVAEGDLNSFAHALALAQAPLNFAPPPISGARLPVALEACSTNVTRSTAERANAKRMFFGGSATYADISAGLTFERDFERDHDLTKMATLITGVAGIGKSTSARRLLQRYVADGHIAFEHRFEFPLQPDLWIEYEKELAKQNSRALLLIDNCQHFQRQLNQLIRALPKKTCLHLVLTAETAAWRPRQKDARLFSETQTVELGLMSGAELKRMRDLLTTQRDLKALLPQHFASQTPLSQVEYLRRRCSADMFVCLKALTDSKTLDDIILREYADIDDGYQQLYRLTAALEASGAIPHRQMVLRLSHVSSSMVNASLDVLQGLVDEFEAPPDSRGNDLGVFFWKTRHQVIAQIIARYKYSDPDERKALFESVIATANPTYYVEVRSLRELCNSDLGIQSLPQSSDRVDLYRMVAATLPTDRVARHRLVRELLRGGLTADAEAELKNAIDDLKLDPPLQRYKIKLLVQRSQAEGLRPEDRKALLREATNEVERGMAQFQNSKYMFTTAADVSEEWYQVTGEAGQMQWAALKLKEAYDRLLDPELQERSDRLAKVLSIR